MKKYLTVIFAILICLSAGFHAVSAAGDKPLPSAITIATGPPGGYQYVTMSYLASRFKSEHGISETPVGGGSDRNIKMLLKGQADIANVTSEPAFNAYRGKSRACSAEEGKKLRLIATTDPAPYFTAVRKNSGINNISDLKGKSYIAKAVTFLYGYKVARKMLEGYGVNPDKDVNIITMTTGTGGLETYKDRGADAIWLPLPTPHHFWTDLIENYDSKLIGIDRKNVREAIIKEFPSHSVIIVPKKTYPGQDKDLVSVGPSNSWLCTEDTPPRLVEIFMEELYDPERTEKLVQVHPINKHNTVERALSNPTLPFHEGAVSYFKKKGVWTKEMEEKQKKLLKEAQ
jgi:uncharacterized protein